MTLADEAIKDCIDGGRSFLLDAGAGSGKTSSLITALSHIRGGWRNVLVKNGQKVACITFTNVAKDEIIERTEHDSLFMVSTIHEFIWNAIKSYQKELRRAVLDYNNSLSESSKRKKPHPELAEALRRVGIIYSDRGSNFLEGRIFHDDLLDIAESLFNSYPLLAKIVSSCFRFIFVDEYQDTHVKVISILLENIANAPSPPVIGLFGDKMQSIYSGGVGELPANLRSKLQFIKKEENYRCSKTVIELLNRIRTDIQQRPAGKNLDGSAVYIDLSGSTSADVFEKAQQVTREKFGWEPNKDKTKVLFLTHRLIARKAGYAELLKVYGDRGGFYQDRFQSGEDDLCRYFLDAVEPLVAAWKNGKAGRALAIVESGDNLFPSAVNKSGIKTALDMLVDLCSSEHSTTAEVLRHIRDSKLLPSLDDLAFWLANPIGEESQSANQEEPDKDGVFFKAFFQIQYQQIAAYRRVMMEDLPYSTKHGVKGAEFDTVYVILDDKGANWNQYAFSNFLAGAENNVARRTRTEKLFYVCCSRAKDKLAVVNLSAAKNGRTQIEGLFGPANCAIA